MGGLGSQPHHAVTQLALISHGSASPASGPLHGLFLSPELSLPTPDLVAFS